MGAERRHGGSGTVVPDRRTGGAPRVHPGTHVTRAQAAAYDAFMRTHSMSETARELNVAQIRVREMLVQYERNCMRDQGIKPPPLAAMLKGDVTTRFGVSRDLRQGRPAKHRPPAAFPIPAAPAPRWSERPSGARALPRPASGTQRLLVTAVEGGAPAHLPFVDNLRAYAHATGAELVCLRADHESLGATAPELASATIATPIEIAGRVDLRPDVALPRVARRPLDRMERASPGRWAVFAHPVFELASMPRLASQSPRVQLTTGCATRARDDGGTPPGALMVEWASDGAVFVRHVRGDPATGAFHDLDARVAGGRVGTGTPVAALVLGDIHHARIDQAAARATWGDADAVAPPTPMPLVDRLRPRLQVMHDVVDFLARNHHDRGDAHIRFLRHATGTGDVRAELAAAAGFLASTRRPWSRTAVVHSNHDEWLARWLRETDHRQDPENAEYYLDRQRAMLSRLRAGTGTASFFAESIRALDPGGLDGVRFLADGESLCVAGVELGVHGHAGADGARGSMHGLERMGIDMIVGHGHRPTASGGIHMTGVCQLDLGYNKGPTSWAIAHVVLHDDGARQHVFMDKGRFAA